MTTRTVLYLGCLTGLFLGVGFLLDRQNGLVSALVLAAVMNVASYWFSDKIVLWMYRAKPLDEKTAPNVHAILAEVARAMGVPKPPLYLVNLPVPNAFATGRNPAHAAVAVTKGILDLLDRDELKGVLAHELSHVKNRDVLVSTIAAVIAGALSVLVRMAYWGAGSRDRRNEGNAISFILLIVLTPLIALLLQLAISRSRELLADETGARAIHNSKGLASALEKLHLASKQMPLLGTPSQNATAHLFIVNPFSGSFLMKIFSTHPPIDERIKRLTALEK
ncbi:zinc metalloprotease HtpX [Candidatus Uhrbacteria bacterium]|nr:zinc metalloprotease HtpX [Candidatus Uhrbacteria bacterium]